MASKCDECVNYEYDEDYGCDATGEYCQCCQCKLTAEECEQLIRKHEN